MSKDVNSDKRKKDPKFIIILLLSGALLLIAAFLVVSIASSLGISIYLDLFVDVSFVLSLIVLLVSSIKGLKKFAQREKSIMLILSISVAFIFAAIRIKVIPNFLQLEDFLTSLIILASYLLILFEKRNN